MSYVSNIFRLPFRNSVWLAILAFMIVMYAALCVANAWEWYCLRNVEKNEESNDEYRKVTMLDNLLVIVGAASQQGM